MSRQNFYINGDHKIAYLDHGPQDPNAPVIFGVHGLTGNSHDFDFCAEECVKQGYRFIAIDLPGRGKSEYFEDPLRYNYAEYCNDIQALISHLRIKKLIWLGVSLGGLLGIKIAGDLNASFDFEISHLIINDVGPEVPQEALDFIFKVISQSYEFLSIKDLEDTMRKTRGLSWGPVSDQGWEHMALHNAKEFKNKQGQMRITYHYDPLISKVFETEPIGDKDLWAYWNNILCPTLLLWGEKSLILPKDIIIKMQKTGPDFDLVSFPDCGHVPSLMNDAQINKIKNWLCKF